MFILHVLIIKNMPSRYFSFSAISSLILMRLKEKFEKYLQEAKKSK